MKIVLLALMALVTACNSDAPQAPTSEEADQLNEAEAMLDELDKNEGPETSAPGPSNSQN